MIALANAAVGQAERCRLEARRSSPRIQAAIQRFRVSHPAGVWLRRRGSGHANIMIGSRSPACEIASKEGHKVLLTVGLVAAPDSPLQADNHITSISVSEPEKISLDELSMITVQAKIHAASALSK